MDGRRNHRLRAALIASVGGFLFGFDWVVIAGAKPFYESHFGIVDSPLVQGSMMAAALAGCLVGSLLAGAMSDRYGRKPLLMASAIAFVGSAVGTAAAGGVIGFGFFRWVGGLAIGMTASTAPLYIAEISRQEHRGQMVSVHQLMIVIGILAAQVANWFFSTYADVGFSVWPGIVLDGTNCWRAMFAIEALPAAWFLWWLRGVPESQSATVKMPMSESRSERGEAFEIAESGNVRRLFVGVLLAVFQQWCGVNILFSYAENVFSAAGYELDTVMTSMVCTGIINLLFTIVAMLVVDRVGRRPLLIVGGCGLAVIFAGLGLAYQNVAAPVWILVIVMSAIALYAMTLAPVTWIVISEIFAEPRRGWQMGLCVASLWTANALLTFLYPSLEASFGIGTLFFAFAGLCAFAAGLMMLGLPETRTNRLVSAKPER